MSVQNLQLQLGKIVFYTMTFCDKKSENASPLGRLCMHSNSLKHLTLGRTAATSHLYCICPPLIEYQHFNIEY